MCLTVAITLAAVCIGCDRIEALIRGKSPTSATTSPKTAPESVETVALAWRVVLDRDHVVV